MIKNKLFQFIIVICLYTNSNYSYFQKFGNLFKRFPSLFYRSNRNFHTIKKINQTGNISKNNIIRRSSLFGRIGSAFTYLPRYLYSRLSGRPMHSHIQQTNLSEEQSVDQKNVIDLDKLRLEQQIDDPTGTKNIIDSVKDEKLEHKQADVIKLHKQQYKDAMSKVLNNKSFQQYNEFEGKYAQSVAQSSQQYTEELSREWLKKYGFVRNDNYVPLKFDIISNKVCKKSGLKLEGYVDLFGDKKFENVKEAYFYLYGFFITHRNLVDSITHTHISFIHELNHVFGSLAQHIVTKNPGIKGTYSYVIPFEINVVSKYLNGCSKHGSGGYCNHINRSLTSILEPFSFLDKYKNESTIKDLIGSAESLYKKDYSLNEFESCDIKKMMLELKEIHTCLVIENNTINDDLVSRFGFLNKESMENLKNIFIDNKNIIKKIIKNEKESNELFDLILFTTLIQIINFKSKSLYGFYENSLKKVNETLYNETINKIKSYQKSYAYSVNDKVIETDMTISFVFEHDGNSNNFKIHIFPENKTLEKKNEYIKSETYLPSEKDNNSAYMIEKQPEVDTNYFVYKPNK
jgi:hypothetical protein